MKSPTPSRRRVLIDTGAFYAFADADDTHHRSAQTIFSSLTNRSDYLHTTSFIVAETHALLLNRLSQQAATQFLKDIDEETHIVMVWVTLPPVSRDCKSQITRIRTGYPNHYSALPALDKIGMPSSGWLGRCDPLDGLSSGADRAKRVSSSL